MTNETQIYRELQKHLDKLPVGFPKTSSGVEIRVLKYLFMPIEAQISVKLDIVPESINKIYKRVKKIVSSKDELKAHLTNMDQKGAILGQKKGKKAYYKNQVLVAGMYEFQINRLTKEFMSDFRQYIDEGFGEEITRTNHYQVRTVPVEQSLNYNNKIYIYDDVRRLIRRTKGKIGLTICICRKGHDLLGEPCTKTDLRESCLMFRKIAKYYISHGFAKPISKTKAFEVLDKAEKEGLILQTGNYQKLSFICTCCGCCCEGLRMAKKVDKPAKLYTSSYYAQIDHSLCKTCKTCLNRCNMNAISFENEIMHINTNLCLGCGVCVITCPTKAIQLKFKDKRRKPPKGPYLLFLKILYKKSGTVPVFAFILKAIWRTRLIYLIRRK